MRSQLDQRIDDIMLEYAVGNYNVMDAKLALRREMTFIRDMKTLNKQFKVLIEEPAQQLLRSTEKQA